MNIGGITLFSGNLGAGKTLGMSIMAYYNHLQGSKVYANYEISGYPVTKIDNAYMLKTMSADWKTFALDEFWLDFESRGSGSRNIDMSQKVLQWRKRGIEALITSQHISQLDVRIRNVTDLIMFPQVTFDNEEFPLYVTFYYTQNKRYHFDNMAVIKRLRSFSMPVIFPDGFNVAENYETNEIVEELETEEHELIKTLTDEYKDFDGTKTQLKSKLCIEHGLPGSKAQIVSDYIFYKNGL